MFITNFNLRKRLGMSRLMEADAGDGAGAEGSELPAGRRSGQGEFHGQLRGLCGGRRHPALPHLRLRQFCQEQILGLQPQAGRSPGLRPLSHLRREAIASGRPKAAPTAHYRTSLSLRGFEEAAAISGKYHSSEISRPSVP